jgi:peptidoglycan/xylan/chitin deacetylase (PgdA/CDA1 family)
MTLSSKPSIRNLARRLKSVVLTPVGTVTSLFGQHDAVALTFDDGPDPEVTPRVLSVLKGRDAHATFFVLTDEAARHPELIKRIAEDGHEIGLHFDRHDRITTLAPWTAWRRLKAARDSLAALAGPVALFRPPYGSQNYATYALARLLGLRVVGWSQQGNDWMEQSVEKSVHDACHSLVGGDIILLHDGLFLTPEEVRPSLDRAEVADGVLARARAQGLRSITVSALLKRGPARLSHWFR